MKNLTKGQRRLLWTVFVLDVLAFILTFGVQASCIDIFCDKLTSWLWTFFIVGIVLLFWLLGQKKEVKE